MAIRPKAPLTYADYTRFPDDGRRWELIEGEAFVVPSPDWHHQDIIMRFARRIAEHLDHHGGGRVVVAPLDVILSEDETVVVQPDVVFVADADAGVIKEKNVKGAPTWLIEVVSDPVRDKKVKRDLYARYGVGEYWATDTDLEQVEIYRPGSPVEIVRAPERPSPVCLPGLRVDLEEVFSR